MLISVVEFQAKIREQMRLETHFQYEFPILGRFGQSGAADKKNPNCHKYATFEASFLCFHGQKYFLFFQNALKSVHFKKILSKLWYFLF